MVNSYIYWLISGIFFLALELINPGFFFFFSFFTGTLGAALASLYGFSLYNQLTIFFALSFVSFLVLYFWFKKNLYGIMPRHGYNTNIFALQGKKAEVLEEIKPPHLGLIKVGGEIWSAKSKDGIVCQIGAIVEIIDVVGCHCIVKLALEK